MSTAEYTIKRKHTNKVYIHIQIAEYIINLRNIVMFHIVWVMWL